MKSKSKILITTGIGTAAIVGGVAPALASTTNVQSSKIDANPTTPEPINPTDPDPAVDPKDPEDPEDPKDPVDPTDPKDPEDPIEPTLLVAKAPTEDHFNMNNMKISESGILSPNTNQVNLNYYLKNLFATTNFFESNKSLFTNSSEYANVSVAYVDNSADFTNKTFKLKVTPVENAFFENEDSENQNTEKNAEPKEITVNIDNEILLASSSIPLKNTISYGVKIEGSNIKSDEDLNKYFETEAFKQDFKINNFSNQSVFVKDKTSVFDWNFTNVNIAYVKNSASLQNKTFKVKVTPLQGYAWFKGITSNPNNINNPVELTIKIADLDEVDRTVVLPSWGWGINFVVNSKFSFKTWPTHVLTWDHLGWFLDPDFDLYWYSNNPSYYKRLTLEHQTTLYEEGWKDLAKYYPVELAGDFNTVKWGYIQRINEGVLFNYSVLVKPKDGYHWEDGTNDPRYINLRLFCSSEVDVGWGLIGKTYYVSNLRKFNAITTEDGLPADIWVHNGLVVVKNILTKPSFQENQKTIENLVKGDLEKACPDYNIEISDIFSASPNYPYNYYGTWHYKIKFTSKTNPSYTKTIDGYLFTITS